MKKLNLELWNDLAVYWGRKAFTNEMIQEYLEHCDFSKGNSLREQCASLCNWYEEVFVNSNFYISSFVNSYIKNSEKNVLVIILAAGKSPLALDVILNNYDKIDRAIEIDLFGMDDKQEVYYKLFPDHSSKLKCITADIRSEILLSLLQKLINEYYHNYSCLVILENASFYLPSEELQKLISVFKSKDKKNVFVFEYLTSSEKMPESKKSISEKILHEINNTIGIPEHTIYNVETLQKLFSSSEGSMIDKKNLHEIEKMRSGKNRYFQTPDDGWVECSAWKL